MSRFSELPRERKANVLARRDAAAGQGHPGYDDCQGRVAFLSDTM